MTFNTMQFHFPKMLSFWCPVMMVKKTLEDVHKKLISGQETALLGPKRVILGNKGPWNSPPSGQTARYRKTEGIQSYLRIWWTYDLIESELSDPKKGGLYGCSVKKTDFANIVKFGHFWGGIAAKICICAKKCSIFSLLWVRTSKKNLCQPSDPWAFWGVVNYMLGSKFTL